MSFDNGREDDNVDAGDGVQMFTTPPVPRTGQLKRGGTTSEPQQQQQLTSSGTSTVPSMGMSGFGPYRGSSVESDFDNYRSSSLVYQEHQPLPPPQDEWHYSLPDSWSCQEKNAAGIVGDEFGLRLVSPSSDRIQSTSTLVSAASSRTLMKKDVALIVTNKPIPMANLIRQAEKRQNELVRIRSSANNRLSVTAATAASAAASSASSTDAAAAAGGSTKPSAVARKPSYTQTNEGGSIFPKFVKPSRHERKDSNELPANEQIADFSSLVGMVAPKGTSCDGSRRKAKTANEIYDGLVHVSSKTDVLNESAPNEKKQAIDAADARTAIQSKPPPPPPSDINLPSFVYYFEVKVISGMAWVGLVPAESVVTHEQAELMMGKSVGGYGSDYNGGLLGAATKPNPFPILMHQIPGKSPESIGLGNDGVLHIGGSTVGRDGNMIHSFTSHYGSIRRRLAEQQAQPWTEPFVGDENTAFAALGKGETVGCGWEIGGKRRIFFTRNGEVLHPDRPINGFDARGDTMFPAVGMETEGTMVHANFGLDPTQPLQFQGNADFCPITSKTDEEKKAMDEGLLRGTGTRPQSLKKLPSETSISSEVAAVVTSDFGDDRPRSAVVGAHAVGPGDEDSQLEAVLKKSMEETSARRPDVEAAPPLTEEGMNEARGIARDLRNVAECPEGADPALLKSLLELCRTKQGHVVSTLQQDSVSVDFSSLLDLNGVLLHSIKAAEGAEAKMKASSKPMPTSSPRPALSPSFGRVPQSRHDEGNTKPSTFKSRRSKEGEMPRSSPEVDELVEAKDFFSLLCLLRGHHNQRLASAYALMRFAQTDTQTDSTDIRKEIQTSGGMHSLLTLFRTSSDGQEIKMVAALAVAYLLPCYTGPDGFLVGSLGLKVITCLRYIVYSSDDNFVEGLNPSAMRESAALALTHIWLNLEPLLSQKEPGDEQEEVESSVSMVSERMPRSQRRGGPLAKAFAVRNVGKRLRSLGPRNDFSEVQNLLEQTVSLIVTVAEKILPSRDREGPKAGTTSTYNIILAVESVCFVEPARSIAVREGLLSVLVKWLNSADNDLVYPAAKSVRFLATLDDSYMAGWIHSQIVNENALPAIVKLTLSDQADVRLAVAEILASLSIAPHTRAAVIDNNGLDYLVQLLANYSAGDGEWNGQGPTTLAVGNALLQLCAGAMANSNKWRRASDAGVEDGLSERAGVLDALVNGGAIEPLIAMAREPLPSKLRLMSVDFLCIVSADSRPRRYLCRSGAAEAFGLVLKQDVPKLYKADKRRKAKSPKDVAGHMRDTLEELYSALLALANLLEPVPTSRNKRARSSLSSEMSGTGTSMEVLRQTAKSGGLESLIILTSLPLPESTQEHIYSADITSSFDVSELGLESSRSLASLCPLLLSEPASASGLTHWAGDVLLALTNVLRRRADGEEEAGRLREEQLDALRGLAYLAKYEPLKIRLIDGLTSQLLQMKSSRSNDAEICKAANQVCVSLGFRDEEIDLQCVGNDPKLAADWFCLERSLVLQAMARSQIRKLLLAIWMDVLHEFGKLSTGGALSTSSCGVVGSILEDESMGRGAVDTAGEENETVEVLRTILFKQLGSDNDSSELRHEMISQYKEIYENRHARSERVEMKSGSSETSSLPFDDEPLDHIAISSLSSPSSPRETEKRISLTSHLRRLSQASSCQSEDSVSMHGASHASNLLGASPCSIIGSMVEREWILTHQTPIDKDQVQIGGFSPLPDPIQELIKAILPSKLLQNEVLPLSDFVPNASFDFRALAMPERSYYSFRREGQVLSRVCEKHASINENEDAFWTLSFTNSTFAGEYAESLVQALYRCPIIQAISFSNKVPNIQLPVGLMNKDEESSGSTILADLAGSLPPWVTCLTFDNILSNTAFTQLVSILKTMGQLDLASENQSATGSTVLQQSSVAGAAFQFLAICNSPGLRCESFDLFFQLLGSQLHHEKYSGSVRHASLQSLVALDLSGNMLGDDSVANLLSIIYDRDSQCSLERLDVGRNSIGRGDAIRQVFFDYVNKYPRSDSGSWCSSLTWLGLSSNNLDQGRLPFDLLEMLANDSLGLVSLDLSNNDLAVCEGKDLLQVLLISLESNERLCSLDLSSNSLSNASVSDFVEGSKALKAPHRLAFLGLKDNEPPLNKIQINGIKQLLVQGKAQRVKDYRDKKHKSEMESALTSDGNISKGKVPFAASVSASTTASGPLDDRMHASDGALDAPGDLQANPPTEVEKPSTSRPLPERAQSERSVATDRTDTDSAVGALPKDALKITPPISMNNKITVLFSAPLVFKDVYNRLCPIDSLDFELERELLWQVFKEASRDIDLSFDCATMNRLQANMTVGCTCLHFSGHGHPSHLTFEDGKGGMQWLAVDILKELISRNAQGGAAPFQFVFVSACHSLLAGETFVRAGVPHVVCCQQESQLMDSAALAFTRAFYLALAIGRTVKDSFEIGRQAVACSPSVPLPDVEMKKFVLLPLDGDHDFPVFDASPLSEWPKPASDSSHPQQMFGSVGVPRRSLLMRKSKKGSSRQVDVGGGNTVAADHHLPTPPQGFLGREVEMYRLLNAIMDKRLVNLVGPVGMGRSSLAAALCHYIHDRKSDMRIENIYYVRARQARRNQPLSAILTPLHKQLVAAGRTNMPLLSSYDMDEISNSVLKALRLERSLLVLDRIEVMEGSEDAQELPLFLNNLFRQTRHVRVLMTAQKPLNLSSLGGVGEYVQELGPLNLKNTVKLFGILCHHVCTAGERRSLLEAMVSREEEDLCHDDASLTSRSKDIFSLLGGGIPARIFDVAYQMSVEEYQALLANK